MITAARKPVSFLLALLLLCGAASGAYAGGFNTYQSQQSNELAKDLPQNPDYDYLRLDPVFLPIMAYKGETSQITVVVTLELPLGTKDDIEAFVPELNDAYLQNLFAAVKSDKSPRNGNDVDVEAVSKLITDVTAKILGEGKFTRAIVKVQTVLK